MYVGQILAEIWSGMISDCHPVLAGYINKEAEEEILNKPLEWKSDHIGESQYSGTSLKRTSSKADTSLRRTKNFVPDEFPRNPL